MATREERIAAAGSLRQPNALQGAANAKVLKIWKGKESIRQSKGRN